MRTINPAMKTNPDPFTGPGSDAGTTDPDVMKSPMVFPIEPPARRKTWFNNYEEEWADFIARSSFQKKRSGLNNAEAKSPPRVWNSPCY